MNKYITFVKVPFGLDWLIFKFKYKNWSALIILFWFLVYTAVFWIDLGTSLSMAWILWSVIEIKDI